MPRAFRQRTDLSGAWHGGVGRLLAALGARDQVGKPVIGLRADDDIDARRAARDFGALGLRDAAGDRDRRRAAILAFQPADVRIDFLRRLRSEARRVGKAWVLRFRSRWSPSHSKKKKNT